MYAEMTDDARNVHECASVAHVYKCMGVFIAGALRGTKEATQALKQGPMYSQTSLILLSLFSMSFSLTPNAVTCLLGHKRKHFHRHLKTVNVYWVNVNFAYLSFLT